MEVTALLLACAVFFYRNSILLYIVIKSKLSHHLIFLTQLPLSNLHVLALKQIYMEPYLNYNCNLKPFNIKGKAVTFNALGSTAVPLSVMTMQQLLLEGSFRIAVVVFRAQLHVPYLDQALHGALQCSII